MKKPDKIIILLFIFLSISYKTIFSENVGTKELREPIGKIWSINYSNKKAVVFVGKLGTVSIGGTLYVYNANQEIVSIQVQNVMHTQATGVLENPAGITKDMLVYAQMIEKKRNEESRQVFPKVEFMLPFGEKINSFAFSPDGKYMGLGVITIKHFKPVNLIDLEDWQFTQSLETDEDYGKRKYSNENYKPDHGAKNVLYENIEFNSTNILWAENSNGDFMRWNLDNGKIEEIFSLQRIAPQFGFDKTKPVTLRFNSSTASGNPAVSIREIRNQKEIQKLELNKNYKGFQVGNNTTGLFDDFLVISGRKDGKSIIFLHDFGGSKRWNGSNNTYVEIPDMNISFLKPSPNQGFLGAIGNQKKIFVLNTTSLSSKILHDKEENPSYKILTFRQDNKILAAASDNLIQIWDIESGKLLNTYHGVVGNKISFSPDGLLLVNNVDQKVGNDSLRGKLIFRRLQESDGSYGKNFMSLTAFKEGFVVTLSDGRFDMSSRDLRQYIKIIQKDTMVTDTYWDIFYTLDLMKKFIAGEIK